MRFAPSSANNNAVAFPIPEVPPVIIAVLFFSFILSPLESGSSLPVRAASCSTPKYNLPTMDSKTLNVLEYPKILQRLAGFCDFSASMDLARALEPTSSFELANALIAETTEARKLLSMQSTGIGGAHDIRPQVDLAARGGVLDPHALLDVKSTLISCRDLKKSFEKRGDEYPRLTHRSRLDCQKHTASWMQSRASFQTAAKFWIPLLPNLVIFAVTCAWRKTA